MMGPYLILQNANIPLQVQAEISCFLTTTTWTQIMLYSHKWRVPRAVPIAIAFAALSAGVQTLLVLTIRAPYSRGVEWPVNVIGILASTLLAAGLIPPYFEIRKRRGRVVGINWAFLLIDWLGAVLSFLALAVQNSFDILGSVLYCVIIVLEVGMFVSHWVWMFRFRGVRQEAKRTGKSMEEVASQPMEKESVWSPDLRSIKALRRPFERLSRWCRGENLASLEDSAVESDLPTEKSAVVTENLDR